VGLGLERGWDLVLKDDRRVWKNGGTAPSCFPTNAAEVHAKQKIYARSGRVEVCCLGVARKSLVEWIERLEL
jgi:hypothetical protein